MKRPEKKELPLTPEEEKVLLKTGKRVFSTAFPNPDAKGCPTPEILKDLVYRSGRFTLKERERWFDHASTCSPCFTKLSSFRQAFVTKRRVKRSVVAVLAVGILSWFLIKVNFQKPHGQREVVKEQPTGPSVTLPPANAKSPEPPPPPVVPPVQKPKPQAIQVALDLQHRGVARSGEKPESDLDLRRGLLSMSIYLPIGSEEGTYEIQILDQNKKAVATAKGAARIRNRVNVLAVDIDTTLLPKGRYNLAIRQAGLGWSRYPLRLR